MSTILLLLSPAPPEMWGAKSVLLKQEAFMKSACKERQKLMYKVLKIDEKLRLRRGKVHGLLSAKKDTMIYGC